MANPIIQREFVGTLRTRRAILLQVAVVAGLSLLVVMRWPSDALVTEHGAHKAAQSLEVLNVFGYGLMVAIILVAPAFPAVSIVRERQQGTLALLLNSPMSASSILFGKVIASIGFLVLVMVLTLPIAAACRAMGGVSDASLIMLYVVLLLLTFQYVSLGLLISSGASSTDSALRMTYGGVLLLSVFSLGPHQFLLSVSGGGMFADLLDWIRAFSPIPAVAETLGQDIGGRGVMRTVSMTQRFVLVSGVMSVLMLLATWLRLRGRLLDRPRAVQRMTEDRSTGAQVFRRIMYLWFFDPQRRGGLIGPLTNPVMIKEFRTRRFGRSGWMVRLIAGTMIVSLLLMVLAAIGAEMFTMAEGGGVATLGAIIVLLQTSLIILLTPSLAAGLISSERESGGWQLLQLTPLSAVTIVTGKLLSVGLVLLLVLLATVPGYVVLLAVDFSHRLSVVNVVVTLTLTACFAMILSAMVSSLMSRTAAATATSYALLVGLCAGTMLIWTAQNEPFSRETVAMALRLNPIAAALEAIKTPGFTDYGLTPMNWWFMLGGIGACLVVLIVQTRRLTRPR